jgi:hypothetical protein
MCRPELIKYKLWGHGECGSVMVMVVWLTSFEFDNLFKVSVGVSRSFG